MSKQFSKKELLYISECLLFAIEEMNNAKKHVVGSESLNGIQKDIERLKKLNDKACSLAEEEDAK